MHSGLTPTAVLRYLNRMLGAPLQELEIDKNEMMRVVFQQSLQTYSNYFPFKYYALVKANDKVPGYTNAYRLGENDGVEIIGVDQILLTSSNMYGSVLVPFNVNPFLSQLTNDMLSMYNTPVTFSYIPPNIVNIKPKVSIPENALVKVKARHSQYLKSIPVVMRDEFLELCLYDVLISIYPLRHRFDSMNTPYGAIQPFLDMVDSAADKRDTLLEKWKSNLLKQGNAKKLWIS